MPRKRTKSDAVIFRLPIWAHDELLAEAERLEISPGRLVEQMLTRWAQKRTGRTE